jgi:hypothetical protein
MIVDHESRTVYSGNPSEMSGMRDAAMAQMEEQLKQMPPEQREMVRKMMADRMKTESGAAVKVDVEIRRTKEKATVAGYSVEKFEVRVGGRHREDIWLTSRISLADELDIDKLRTFMESMAWGGTEETAYTQSGEYFELYMKGFPLKQSMIMPGGNVVSEAEKVEQKKIPDASFAVPADYARKGLEELGKMERLP